ncbi:MAG: glycosyltransferase [Acidobacteriia bacterium]|nr:glycosyltransferase [Terriglobia bacterium]
MSQAVGVDSALHVLTLTSFFPSKENEVSGCFIAESNKQLEQFGVRSSVIAVSPIHYPRKEPSSFAPAEWMRYPQVPGNLGLSNAGLWLYARLLAKVSRLHRERPIDLIHAHSALPCGHAAVLLSRRLNIPFVVTVHGLDVFNTCFRGGMHAKWRRRVSIDVYRSARTVICISERVQRLLRDGMPEGVRSTVVYNGTDTNFFSPAPNGAPPQQENEILIVGNLNVEKGHELVLRAIRQIEASFPKLHCRIIGDGRDRARIEALARDLGVAQRVRVEGRKSRADVANAMRACSVFVLPSRYEGLGCVYLEAMACGKPVIACRGQGIDEIIEHENNGWLIPVEGLDELAQGLSILLRSQDLCLRLGASARETVLNGLTLSDQARRLAQIYGDAIAGAGHPL